MFGEGHHDSVVQRGIDEALACQDMLERSPVKPSLLSRAVMWVVAAARSIARRQPDPDLQVTSVAPHSSQ